MSDLLKEIYIKQAQREKSAGTESEKIASLNAAYAQAEKVKKQREINALRQKSADLKVGSINQKVAAAKAQQSAKEKISREQQLQNLNHDFYLSMLEKGIYDPNAANALGVSETAYKGALSKIQADIAARNAAASGGYIDVGGGTGGDTGGAKELTYAEKQYAKRRAMNDDVSGTGQRGVKMTVEEKATAQKDLLFKNPQAAALADEVTQVEASAKTIQKLDSVPTKEEADAAVEQLKSGKPISSVIVQNRIEKEKATQKLSTDYGFDKKTSSITSQLQTLTKKHGTDKVMSTLLKYKKIDTDAYTYTQNLIAEYVAFAKSSSRKKLTTEEKAILLLMKDSPKLTDEGKQMIDAVLVDDFKSTQAEYKKQCEKMSDEKLQAEIESPSQTGIYDGYAAGVVVDELEKREAALYDKALGVLNQYKSVGTSVNTVENINVVIDDLEQKLKGQLSPNERQKYEIELETLKSVDPFSLEYYLESEEKREELSKNGAQDIGKLTAFWQSTQNGKDAAMMGDPQDRTNYVPHTNPIPKFSKSDYWDRNAKFAGFSFSYNDLTKDEQNIVMYLLGKYPENVSQDFGASKGVFAYLGSIENRVMRRITAKEKAGGKTASIFKQFGAGVEDSIQNTMYNLAQLESGTYAGTRTSLSQYQWQNAIEENDIGTLGKFIGDALYSAGQQVPRQMISKLYGPAGHIISDIMFGSSIALSTWNEKKAAGWSNAEAAIYTIVDTAFQTVTEHFLDGFNIGAKGTLTEALEGAVDKLIKNGFGRGITKWLINAGSEGLEEFVQGLGDYVIEWAVTRGQPQSELEWSNLLYDAAIGFALGSTGATINAVSNASTEAENDRARRYAGKSDQLLKKTTKKYGEHITGEFLTAHTMAGQGYTLNEVIQYARQNEYALPTSAIKKVYAAGKGSFIQSMSESAEKAYRNATGLDVEKQSTWLYLYNAGEQEQNISSFKGTPLTPAQAKAAYEFGKEEGEITNTKLDEFMSKMFAAEKEQTTTETADAMMKSEQKHLQNSFVSASAPTGTEAQQVRQQVYDKYNDGSTQYPTAFNKMYLAGKQLGNFDEAYESIKDLLSEQAAREIYDAGNLDRGDAGTTDLKVRKGEGTYRDEGSQIGESVYKELYETVAKLWGIDISTVSNLDGNGKFLPSLVKILISDKTKNELQTLGHELVEYARAFGGKKYTALRDAVIDYYVDKKGRTALDNEIENYLKAYRKGSDPNTNYEQAEKEFVADFIGGILANEAGLKEFVDQVEQRADLTTAEKRNIFQSLIDLIRKALEKIEEFLGAGQVTGAVRAAAEVEADTARNMIRLLTDALDTSAETVSKINDGDTVTISGSEGTTRYSFQDSKSGMANDALLPYDNELKQLIEDKGGYIIDSYDKLVDVVNRAFDNPNEKATAYFGILSPEILSKIEKSVPNIPKELNGTLFKAGRTYSVAATMESMRHLVKEKKAMNRQDVVDYLDKMADTIIDNDTVTFDWYYDNWGKKEKGLLFKRTDKVGVVQSFEMVSNKKRILGLVTFYMKTGDYIKKKSAETPLMQKTSAHTPKAKVGQTSSDTKIPQKESDVKNNSMQSPEKNSKVERKSIDIDDIIDDPEKIKEVRLRNDLLKQQFQITDGTRRSVPKTRSFANRLLKEYESSYSYADLSDDLIQLYDYIGEHTGSSVVSQKTLQDITERANAVAKRIVDNEKANKKLTDDAKECLSRMKTAKIFFTDAMKQEAIYLVGSWSAFQKQMKGTANITTKISPDAVEGDVFLENLSEEFPQFFKGKYNEGDVPSVLLQADQVLHSSVQNGWRAMYDKDEAIYAIGEQILAEYSKIPASYTLADKQQKKLDNLTRRLDKENEWYHNRVSELRARTNLAIEREQRAYDYKQRRETVESIRKIYNDLTKRALRPSERMYIPDEFKRALAQLMEIIDFSTKKNADGTETKMQQRQKDVVKKIKEIANRAETVLKESRESDAAAFGFQVDDGEVSEEAIAKLKTAAELLGKYNVNMQVPLSILRNIEEGLSTFRRLVTDTTRLIGPLGQQQRIDAYMARVESAETVCKARKRVGKSGSRTAFWAHAMNALGAPQIMEEIVGHDESSILYKLFNEELCRDGLKNARTYVMNAEKMFEHLQGTSKQLYKYVDATEVKEWSVRDSRGKKIRMSEMTAVTLLMTWQREIHTEDHIHLQMGGALIPNPELLAQGKKKAALAQGQFIPNINKDIIKLIEAELSSYARDWMHTAMDYFENYSAPQVNNVAQQVYHRDIATNKWYVPYFVYEGARITELEGEYYNNAMVDTGYIKEAVKGAAQPLCIYPIDTVLTRHIDGMSAIVGYLIPVQNFSKVWNGLIRPEDLSEVDKAFDKGPLGTRRSLKSIVEAQFGEKTVQAIERSLVELGGNTGHEINIEPEANLFRKMTNNAAKAIFTGNIRTTAGQYASFYAGLFKLRMINGLRPDYPLKALFRGKKIDARMEKWTPFGYDRKNDISFANVEWGSSNGAPENAKHEWMVKPMRMLRYAKAWAAQRPAILKPTKWLQAADVVTSRAMWLAAENDIKKQYKKAGKENEIGSDDFYAKVTKIYDETIAATQPYYSLHRPQIMKSQHGTVRDVMRFKTQAMLNKGNILNAYGNWMAKQGTTEGKKAGKQFVRTLTAQLMGQTVNMLLKTMASALFYGLYRYRDEEDGEITWENFLINLGEDALSGVAELFSPVLGANVVESLFEVFDWTQGNTSNRFYDTFASVGIDTLNDIWNAFDKMMKVGDDLIDGEMNDLSSEEISDKVFKTIWDAIVVCFAPLGIPFNNAKNLYQGIKYWYNVVFDSIKNGEFRLNDSLDYTDSQQYKRAYDALMDGDRAKYTSVYDEYIESRNIELEGLTGDKLAEKQKEIENSWHKGICKQLKENHAEKFTKAAEDVANGNLNAYVSVIKEFEQKGFDREDVAKTIYSMKSEDDEKIISGEVVEGTIYHPQNLYYVVNTPLYDEIYKELYDAKLAAREKKAKEEGKTIDAEWMEDARAGVHSDLHEVIRDRLKEESRIETATLDYEAADFGTYRQTVDYYVGKGFDVEDVAKAIRSGSEDKTKLVEGTIYSYRDLLRAAATGYQSEIQSEIYAAKEKAGETKKEIRESIQRSATDYFRPLYDEGTPAERAEIKNKIVALGCYENPYKTIKNWYENPQKKK